MKTLPSFLTHLLLNMHKYKKPQHFPKCCFTYAANARRNKLPRLFTSITWEFLWTTLIVLLTYSDHQNWLGTTLIVFPYIEWLPKSTISTWTRRLYNNCKTLHVHVLWNRNDLARLYTFVRLNATLKKRMDIQGSKDHLIIWMCSQEPNWIPHKINKQ